MWVNQFRQSENEKGNILRRQLVTIVVCIGSNTLDNKRKRQYKEKALHSQFERTTEEIKDKDSWNWLKKGTLKKETEGVLMAAQDQALRTNYTEKRIDKQDVSPMCRICGEREETISHIVAKCSKLAQK